MSTHEIYSDSTERIVRARINDGEKLSAYRYEGATKHWFVPVEAVLKFLDDTLVTVQLRGPLVLRSGKLHATKWASWNWPYERGDQVAADVPTVWETNPPSSLASLLTELGVPR